MLREQQMQVQKLHGQQGIKPSSKQPSTEARISAIETQLRVISQPEVGEVMINEGEICGEAALGRNSGNPGATHQALGDKHKETN